ncbi:MAG: hypothetical protein ACRESS_08105 [Stenotrophobium sp.]
MSKLTIRAEIIKLERLYGADENALAFLQTLPAAEIRKLREAAQAKLFGDDLTLFQRLAAASVLLPLALIAMMAEKIFGPVLGARVAGEMNWKRAVDLASRLPIPFLADISLQLDPKRAREIIQNLPPERIRDVAVELLKRHEFITMGRFVDYLTEAAIRKSMEAFTNPADLLHAGFFIENKTQLNNLIRMLTDDRLRGVIIAAQDPQKNLWAEAVALMEHVDDSLKRKLGDLTAEQDETALAGLCQTAYEQDLWDSVLPVVACMSEPSHRKLLRIPALSDRKIMESILKAADDNGLWPSFLPLIQLMSPEQLAMIAEVAVRLPAGALENILRAAHAADLWESVLHLVEDMDEAQIAQLGAAASVLPREAIARIIQIADDKKLWHALLPLAGKMEDSHKRMVASLASLVTHDTRERIVAAARTADNRHWPALLDIVAHIPRDARAEFAGVIADHARREPHLIETLAPAAQARGLDDLLDIARQSLKDGHPASARTIPASPRSEPTPQTQRASATDLTSEQNMPQQEMTTQKTSPRGLLSIGPLGRLRGITKSTIRQVENVLGVSDDSFAEQQAASIKALQKKLSANDAELRQLRENAKTLQAENAALQKAAALGKQESQRLERELAGQRDRLRALQDQAPPPAKISPVTKPSANTASTISASAPVAASRPAMTSRPAATQPAITPPTAATARQPAAKPASFFTRFIARPVEPKPASTTTEAVASWPNFGAKKQPSAAKPVHHAPAPVVYTPRSAVTPQRVAPAPQPATVKPSPRADVTAAPVQVKPGMSPLAKTILVVCGLGACLIVAIIGGTLLPILFH